MTSFSGLNLTEVKKMALKGLDKARQYAEGLTDTEMKVEEATNSDKWGPHGKVMQDITKRAFRTEDYKQILGILARRLHSESRQWRQVYKSLLLLEYMAKNGPERMVAELKSNAKVFGRLQRFEYMDSQGTDQGLNVRNRAKQLWELVNDAEAIKAEREKARQNRNKFGGMDNHGFTSNTETHVADFGPSKAPIQSDGESTSSVALTAAELESKMQHLSLAGTTGNAALPEKHKPKLSQIKADSTIQATLANFPVTNPAAQGMPGDDRGFNLLDLESEEVEPKNASGTGSDVLHNESALADTNDWADFATPPSAPVLGESPRAAPDVSSADPFGGDPFASTPVEAVGKAALDLHGTMGTPVPTKIGGERMPLPPDAFTSIPNGSSSQIKCSAMEDPFGDFAAAMSGTGSLSTGAHRGASTQGVATQAQLKYAVQQKKDVFADLL